MKEIEVTTLHPKKGDGPGSRPYHESLLPSNCRVSIRRVTNKQCQVML
jgi:hypothetical protein